MSKKIKAASVQMDATLASTTERLARAAKLVENAAKEGAELVLLPELFNTGYGYTDENFARAEGMDGKTVNWLKTKAAEHRIYLAGSLMLRDAGEIYNALLLFAPDGQMWRYDKNYPWGWERGYFRERRETRVAKTLLGDIGLLLCWDAAHTNLWQAYAGNVDLMLISACPPDVTNPTYLFPSGAQITLDDFGMVGRALKNTGSLLFGDMVNEQTAWLGVPAVQSVGTGHLKTALPRGFASLLSYLPAAPKLAKRLPEAKAVTMEADFVPGCKVVNAKGQVLKELAQTEGESFTIAEIEIREKRPSPQKKQPKSLLPRIAYLSSDVILPFLMRRVYKKGLKKTR